MLICVQVAPRPTQSHHVQPGTGHERANKGAWATHRHIDTTHRQVAPCCKSCFLPAACRRSGLGRHHGADACVLQLVQGQSLISSAGSAPTLAPTVAHREPARRGGAGATRHSPESPELPHAHVHTTTTRRPRALRACCCAHRPLPQVRRRPLQARRPRAALGVCRLLR